MDNTENFRKLLKRITDNIARVSATLADLEAQKAALEQLTSKPPTK